MDGTAIPFLLIHTPRLPPFLFAHTIPLHPRVQSSICYIYHIAITSYCVTCMPAFLKLIYKPSYCNFPEKRKKILRLFFLFYPLTLNIICFVEK